MRKFLSNFLPNSILNSAPNADPKRVPMISSRCRFPDYLSAILNSYCEIFFIQGRLVGALLLAISMLNYNTALAGLFSVAVAYLFAYLSGFKAQFLDSGYYTYNPLLVGLSIGSIFKLSAMTLAFVAISSVLTFVVTVFLAGLLYNGFRLQVLSIPFVVVSSLVYLATGRFSNLFVSELYSHALYQDLTWLPISVNAFFKSVGAIIFMPNVISGMLISLLILLKSRIILFLAIAGFYLGTITNGLFIGSMAQSYANMANFNYILIAVAIGGIFHLPSPKSYLMAAIAVLVSTLLLNAVDVFWSLYNIPVFTLPFTLITLSFVYLLSIVDFKMRPLIFKSTPEETLDHYLTNAPRFPSSQITLGLPFHGQWTVWQGFDGQWTHQGLWRYAYDFIINDHNGCSHAGRGDRLDDYFAYQQSVLSPIRGRVVRVISHLDDNPIGSVDTLNNWGNLVIIYDERGFFVELSHFVKDSIVVFEGGWVEPGSLLGRCGNSGYSPQPHIHIQVQSSALIGGETLPFHFVHFFEYNVDNRLNANHFHSHGQPDEGSTLVNALVQPYIDQLTTFILDEKLRYQVYHKGQAIDHVEFVVRMEFDGTFYWQHHKSKLYFGKRDGALFCYHMVGNDRYLRLIQLCLPSVPLHFNPQLSWSDTLPNQALLSPMHNLLGSILNALTPSRIRSTGNYHFSSDKQIEGVLKNRFFGIQRKSQVELDPYLKFKTLRLDDMELRRTAATQITSIDKHSNDNLNKTPFTK